MFLLNEPTRTMTFNIDLNVHFCEVFVLFTSYSPHYLHGSFNTNDKMISQFGVWFINALRYISVEDSVS